MDKDGVKFACLCARLFPFQKFPPTLLGSGFHLEQPWAEVQVDTWREALGTWQCEEIERANLWVWAVAPSSELAVDNHENRHLQHRILNFWMSLLLHEVSDIQTAWVLTGSLLHGEPTVRTLQPYPRVKRHALRREPSPTIPMLSSIAKIADVLETAYKDRQISGRFDRGITAFISGKQSGNIDEAILCFVRAMEGILHPSDKEKFCRRAEKIVRLSPDSSALPDLLAAIYDARSGFTHAEALTTVFPGLSQRDARLRGRELQAAIYLIATRSYVAALSDPKLVRLFSTEPIGEFWGKVASGRKPPPFSVPLNAMEYTLNSEERVSEEEDDG